MKITEIDWTEGKKYKAKNRGFIHTVKNGKLVDTIGVAIEEICPLKDITEMEFEEIKEKKYYLKLNKPYVKTELAYLNYLLSSERILMCSKTGNVKGYKTQFTKTEIKELIDKFGGSILDFERVEVGNENN